MPKASIAALSLALTLVVLSGCDGGSGDKGQLDGAEDETPEASYTEATATELNGTFYFLAADADGAAVWSLTDGGEAKRLLSGDANLWASANVSPDGHYLSYVDMDSKLRIHDLELDLALKAERDNADPNCKEPVWSPDTGQLLVHVIVDPDITAEWLKMPLGESTDAEPVEGCHVRYGPDSDDDEYAVIAGDLSGVIMRDGDEENTVPGDTISGRVFSDLVSVADDNAAICVATVEPQEPVGDAARGLGCDTIIDTKTRKPVDLPGTVRSALFPASGGIVRLTSEGELVLSDGGDDEFASAAVPAELADAALLGYVEPS